MGFIGNFLWLVFGGWLVGLCWLLYGVLCCLTIIGIPFGIACFRIMVFAFLPFGKELVPAEWVGEKPVIGAKFMNVIWCIFCGFWLCLAECILGLSLCCTIVGIPFGLAHFKIAAASFAPLSKRIVSKEIAQAARAKYAEEALAQKLASQAGAEKQ